MKTKRVQLFTTWQVLFVIDDKSVADQGQVVQRVVTAYYRMDADQMCSELQMFNQFKVTH